MQVYLYQISIFFYSNSPIDKFFKNSKLCNPTESSIKPTKNGFFKKKSCITFQNMIELYLIVFKTMGYINIINLFKACDMRLISPVGFAAYAPP